MVEQIEGKGAYFQELSRKLGIESRLEYRLLWFGQDPRGYLNISREPEVLSRLAIFPEFDKRSKFVVNVRDNRDRPRDVLAIPVNCPDLTPDGGLPVSDETYIAMVWKKTSPNNPLEILVLDPGIEKVKEIARISAGKILSCGRADLDVEAYLITPEEFVEIAKEQIDRGIRLKNFILRFADLREYQRRADEQFLKVKDK